MLNKKVIGVDLGGTNVSIGKIESNTIIKYLSSSISSQGEKNQILKEVIHAIEKVFDQKVAGIGIGVPSIVDAEKGIVYDVQNIPSWEEVPLKEILESHFHTHVYINNDANCFAVGEKYFGKGIKFRNFVGLTIGTGLGAGIIIDNQLYSGINCGAGELGFIPYKEHTFEYYCSGQFFLNEYSTKGEDLLNKANRGDSKSIKIFGEFGAHLGNAIMAILFAFDPEAIILGGSVCKSFLFFQEAMWNSLKSFPYMRMIDRLVIERSDKPHIALLGAAALCCDKQS